MKKRLEDIAIYLPTESMIYPTKLFCTRNDKCPNDSRRIRRIMPFVASVPIWFLAGKYALQNFSMVCREPLWIFFFIL